MLAACLAHGLLLLVTTHVFVADAPNYASDVAEHLNGWSCRFYDFGHLLWRPLGAAMSLGGDRTAGVAPVDVLQRLDLLATLFGFLAVAALSAWLLRATRSLTAAGFGVAFLLLGKAFLNFSQVGTSYVPALALLATGLLLLLIAADRRSGGAGPAVLGGVALALSVFLWAPFALAIPGALLSALILRGVTRETRATTAWASAGGALTSAVVMGWVAWQLRLYSVADLRAWMGAASHGIDLIGGAPRAVIGLARSVVDLGDLGTEVKRYLVGDPAAPSHVLDLLGVDLALFLAFYAFALACVVLAARSGRGRRALAVLVITALPVGWFAISWQGGDLERYLPLLPAMLLTVAAAAGAAGTKARGALAIFLGVTLAANGAAMLNGRVRARQEPERARLEAATRGRGPVLLVTVTHQDALWELGRNYPRVLEAHPGTDVVYLLLPGTPQVDGWRASFAERALRAWAEGTEVRLTDRLLGDSPAAAPDWVEGDDPRITWSDLQAFVGALELTAPRAEDPDGFVTLERTEENRATLARWADASGGADSEKAPCRFPPRRASPQAR